MLRNNYFFGFFLGAIIPMLGIFMVYLLRYSGDSVSIGMFLRLMRDNPRTISSTVSLGLIACIPLFTYYKNRKLYKTLYGIFAAVAIYAAIVIIYRFNLV